MSRIFVLAASKMEADPLVRLLGPSQWDASSHSGPIKAGLNDLEFFITGMGPERARKRVGEILHLDALPRTAGNYQDQKPHAVIVIGLCGGLAAALPETTIVSYSSCLSAMSNGASSRCVPTLSGKIIALFNVHNLSCTPVTGITSARIAISKDDKLRLARAGAEIVDMESYEILSVAQECGIPAAVVRVVSDSLDRKLPDFNRALNPDGSVNNGKALRVMLGSPLLTARAYSANRRAARHLANALQVVLSAEFPRFP